MKNGRPSIDLEAVRTSLFERQDALAGLNARRAGDRRAVELDQTRVGRLSRMDAMQLQAMAEATQRRRQVELQRIEAALRRLEEGEYGYCVTCGEPVGLRRLELDPATPDCIDCARAADGRR